MIDVLKTGNQLAAARALAGLSQADVAQRSGIHINTLGLMERRGARLISSGYEIVQRVMTVFREEGVTFLDDDEMGLGVRFTKPSKIPTSAPRERGRPAGSVSKRRKLPGRQKTKPK